ncbi:MAG: hypothetical protein OHK0056_25160 [Bacteriovoracaceae bacterium]
MRSHSFLPLYNKRKKRSPYSIEHLSSDQKAIVHNILKKKKYLLDCQKLRFYRNLSDIPWNNDVFLAHIHQKGFSDKTKALISLSKDSGPLENIYLSFDQTRNLMLAPPRYLTEKEALILAINIRHHFKESFEHEATNEELNFSGERKKHKYLHNISNYLKRTKDKDILSQHTLFRALDRFDFAINCETYPDQSSKMKNKKSKERREALLESRSFFLILVKMRRFLEIAIPFMGLIETLLKNYTSAIKWLLQGTRLMVRPGLLFSLIEKIYEKLEMKNVATFYQSKARSHELNTDDLSIIELETKFLEAA